jgi:hypothetical protein
MTPGQQTAAEPNPGKIDRLFAKAVERRTKGRAGLYMQSRHPNENWENGRPPRPIRCSKAFPTSSRISSCGWARPPAPGCMAIFSRRIGCDFAGGDTVYNGALSDSAAVRDYNPRSF